MRIKAHKTLICAFSSTLSQRLAQPQPLLFGAQNSALPGSTHSWPPAQLHLSDNPPGLLGVSSFSRDPHHCTLLAILQLMSVSIMESHL